MDSIDGVPALDLIFIYTTMAKDDQSVNMKPLAYIMTTTYYRSIYVYIIYIFIYTSLLTFTVKVASVNESKKIWQFFIESAFVRM